MLDKSNDHSLGSRQLIIASARADLEKNGILGLRVANVAEGAHCSITQIYRFFGDRDGLLAQVLGDIYEEAISKSFEAYMAKIKAMSEITIDSLVDSLPSPSEYGATSYNEIRLQILAVSVVNPSLRNRVEQVSQNFVPRWDEALDFIEAHLAPGVKIDRRVFTIMLLLQTMYYRNLLGDLGFTDEEYKQFLRDKFRMD